MADSSSAWDLLDGMLVINLDTSMERMEHFLEVNAFLPQKKIHRLSACLGRSLPGYGKKPWFTEKTGDRAAYWGGAAGCTMSHRKAIETAQKNGWKNVLVLEDDVEFVNNPAAFEALQRALSTLKGNYMLYLGYSRPTPYGSLVIKTDTHGVWKVEGVLSTYAYLVPESLYDQLLANLPTEETIWPWMAKYRAIDSFYRDVVAEMKGVSIYAILPDIVQHNDAGISEIGGTTTVNRHSRTLLPHKYNSVRGCLHRICSPLRRLKVKLNALRTSYRARHNGFPGSKKKKPA